MTTVVLIAAAGAAWEPDALALLEAQPGVVVLRRCVDVDDLLAAAAARQSDVAVVAVDAPGLDAAVVARLRHHGVRPVAVLPGASEAAAERAARVGISATVPETTLGRLPAALVADEPPGDQLPAGWPVGEGADTPVVSAADGASDPEAGGRVLAVWGPAGAPGRTTVAAGLAAELARRGVDTLLVDADPYGGAVAQVLGVLDEVSGLLAASRLAGTGQLPDRLPEVVRALSPHLGLVSGLPRPDRWSEVRPGVLDSLLGAARRHGHVVVDTGFCLEDDPGAELAGRSGRNQLTLEALAAADAIVAVGSADPVGLTRLARGLAELRERDVHAPIHVVVNRVRPTLGWRERDIAEVVAGLGKVVHPAALHLLPDDRVAVDRALAEGRLLTEAAPDAPVVRALRRLADGFVRAPGARRANRVRGRLLRSRPVRSSEPAQAENSR